MAYPIEQLMHTDAATDLRIRAGIEANRKGNFVIRTQPGETVTVRLRRHHFRFGCNLFMLDEIPDDPRKNDVYKEKLAEFFNMATLPFYWDATEPEEGKTRYAADSEKMYRRPPIDLCMDFCRRHDMEPREHALCYDYFYPKWLWDQPDAEVKRHIEKRMQEISRRYADSIPTIEVTNELFWERGRTAFYSSPDYVDFCFRMAEKYFPDNTLCINDWTALWEQPGTPWDPYAANIAWELQRGGRIDAIGLQYHVFHRAEEYFDRTRKLYDLPRLFRILDNYARFGLPIQITEVTIPAFTDRQEDEESQADVLERLYSLWFSYPNVTQIVYWNLADGYAAFTTPGNMTDGENYYRGGLLRFDMSEKPAFRRLRHLITEVWTTNETVTADAQGEAHFRGFYGDYDVTRAGVTTRVTLNTDGEAVTL